MISVLRMARLLCVAWGLLLPFYVSAAVDRPPPVTFQQNLGEQLPMDTQFTDVTGTRRSLAHYFGRSPVIMVFGYYQCPRLCSTLMEGILQVVHHIGEPYAIVGIGIDPRETPQDAAHKLKAYGTAVGSDSAPHLLTGEQAQISRLAQAAGFQYRYDRQSDQYSHPAGFLVATPGGEISQYFSGVRFDRRDLRQALRKAANDRVGSWTDQVLLLCSHYDPVTGRYTVAVMKLVRIFGGLCVFLLAFVIWRLHRRAQARPS